jgi:transposase-like protein
MDEKPKCPECKSSRVEIIDYEQKGNKVVYECNGCGATFKED